jgi:hypothetical protein
MTMRLSKAVFVTAIVVGLTGVIANAQNLTGRWLDKDYHGTYFIMQDGDDVWWAGVSGNDGRDFTNVFHGRFSSDHTSLDGAWADVPRGRVAHSGTLHLQIRDGRIYKQSSEGGVFGASQLRRLTPEELGRHPYLSLIAVPGFEEPGLTGVWSGSNSGFRGTFYWRQVGDLLMWLGLVGDDPAKTCAAVFEGRISANGQIEGRVKDIPWRRTGGCFTPQGAYGSPSLVLTPGTSPDVRALGAGPGQYVATRGTQPFVGGVWTRVKPPVIGVPPR